MPELSPQSFSFNSPLGMCVDCNGLGSSMEIDADLIVPDPSKSISEGAIEPWGERAGKESGWTGNVAAAVSREFGIPLDKPWKKLTPRQREVLLFGAGDKRVKVSWAGKHGTGSWAMRFSGVVNTIKKRMQESTSEVTRQWYGRYFREQLCRACSGQRLRPESRAVLLAGKSIVDVTGMTVAGAAQHFTGLGLKGARAQIATEILKEMNARLGFLLDVGLEYLTLDRAAATLSGGEAQRIRLASQLGSELSGVMYVLDEPSIGLHQRDNLRLIATLRRLRDLGNSVIVVEHDEETIEAADHVVDFGPGAGRLGGRAIAEGTPEELKRNPNSLTGRYLSGAERIEVPTERRKPQGFITVKGAREHNLKDIDVKIPLGVLVAVTGVSGAGKSSLINGILQPALRRQLLGSYDQIGRHGVRAGHRAAGQGHRHRSEADRPHAALQPGDLHQGVRLHPRAVRRDRRGARLRLSAGALLLQRARRPLRGVRGRRRAAGRDALPGRRLRPLRGVPGQALQRGDAAREVQGPDASPTCWTRGVGRDGPVPAPPHVARRSCSTLGDVGLGYIALGQPATTLSGGEAQRIKLSRELAKRDTGRTLYILDEPTTGLHFEDMRKLLSVLGRLVAAGNTVLVIEHNLDVIKSADWVIDLGPEGGDRGGEVVAAGTPEEVARAAGSYTGQFLAPLLGIRRARATTAA